LKDLGGRARGLAAAAVDLRQLRLLVDSPGALTFDFLISSKTRPVSRMLVGWCFMRRASLLAVVLSGLVLSGASALAADSGPVIVLPGRHGLPVIINGVDVTGAVLEGDWGLYSPHMVGPTIVPAWVPGGIYQGVYYRGRYVQGSYYPAFGHEPGYGRHEIEPPADRRLPPPAPSYHRSWTSESAPLPANLEPQVPPPPLIVAPQIFPGGRRGDAAGRGP
jgi:hypothetical protein